MNHFKSKTCKFACLLSFALLSCFSIAPCKAARLPHQTAADSTSLKAFEGIYQMQNNPYMDFNITAVGDKLIAKNLNSDQQITLTRKSEFGFEMPDDDGDETVQVIFSKNSAGDIAQITVGGNQLWVKIKDYVPAKAVTLTADQLKAYEGKYEFEQKKGTFLQITASANGLTLKQLWDGREIPFIAIGDDTFLNKQIGFPLKFTMDKSGNAVKVLAFNRDTWDKVQE